MKKVFTYVRVICLMSIMFMCSDVYAGITQIDSIEELQKIDNAAANTFISEYELIKDIDVSLVIGTSEGKGEGEGEGIPEVIQIDSIEELQKIGNDAAYPLDGEYELTQDIAASDTANWNNGAGFKPIGTIDAPFIGKFDGKEYKITGLYINRSDSDYIGLFAYIGSGGEVKNIKIETCQVIGRNSVGSFVGINYGSITNIFSTATVSGSEDVGGFAGKNNGNITDSSCTGTVSGSINTGGFVGYNEVSITNSFNTATVSGSENVGGFAGKNNGNITDSSCTGTVSGSINTGGFVGYNEVSITNSFSSVDVSGYEDVGGFVGKNDDSIDNCYSMGTVLGNKNVGGLTGENGYCDSSQICHGSIADSYSTSAVWGKENVGGLVGYGNGDTVTHSYSTGAVWGDNNVGGLVGYNNVGSIVKTYSTSPVWGDGNYVGGLVGLNGYNGSITDGFSEGVVSGGEYVGGLVGKNMSSITNCYSTGTVWSSGDYVGGLIGLNTGNSTSSYWNIETSNQTSSAGGEGKTTAEMKQQATYIDWDFVSVWVIKIEEGEGEEEDKVSYPCLIELGPTHFSILPISETKEINTLEDLSKIGLNPDYPWWWNYELMADIDASETINLNNGKGFNPLRLVGEFNGNTHEIASLYINRPDEDNIGLFGILGPDGQVRDIGLDNCSVVGNNTVGSLVGWNKGNIISCYKTGTVSGNGDVGGLVGINENSITNSYSMGTVSGIENYIGGLVGKNKNGGDITNSYSTGTVFGNQHIGGLVGQNEGSITSNYSASAVSGIGNIGGLVGSNANNIENCYTNGTVAGNWRIGGLVGWNYGYSITDSYNKGTVSGSEDNIGGLVGYNDGSSIEKTYNAGAVTGNGNYVGGLIGYNNAGSITSSYNKGTVEGDKNYIGGLIGWNYGNIAFSYNLGKISGVSYVGGLVGNNNNGTITDSYNMGAISATLDYVGGITGYNENFGNIIRSYNLGAVSGNNDVGGVVGLNRGSITFNFSTGAVTGSSRVGGLVGENYGSVTSSYWDIETSGQTSSAGGEGKTTTKLKQQATYADWDFDNDWNIVEGSSYPFLKRITYKPDITILGETSIIIECKTAYEDAGATAYDIPDGDLTNDIIITNNVNTEIVGDYAVEYVVTDSENNTSNIETRLVYVVDTVLPEITLNEDNPMTVECNSDFIDPGASATDTCDNDVTVDIVSNNVDTTRTGTYQVVYRAVDDSGNTIETTREVIVNCGTEGTTEGTVEGIQEGTAEGTTEGTPEGTAEGVHEGIAEGTTEGAAEGTTEGTQEGIPEGTVEGTQEGIHEGTPEGIPEGTAEGVHEGITEGTAEGEGEGISDVIKIDSIEELQKIGNDAAYPLSGNYELTRDIDASDTINWNDGAGFKPIGTYYTPFVGKFNGNGHKITGLYINRSGEDYVGLFGYIGEGAEIKNLGVEDCYILGSSYVGGLVGRNGNGGSITNSYSAGAVSGDDDVGGLVGRNNGSITSSCGTGVVSGSSSVGGLVGSNGNWDYEGSITNSYSTGAVYGSSIVGGLVGRNYGNITSSYSTEAVSGDSYVGGLVGYNEDGSITSSYWDKETSGQSSSDGGEGKTTAEMKQQANYINWDFVNIWAIQEGLSYPYLRVLGPTVEIPAKGIGSIEELGKIGVDRGYPLWGNYELVSDIDASATLNWNEGKGFMPIGTQESPFLGKFNGKGYKIIGLHINCPDETGVGLFGYIDSPCEIRNLGLEGCEVIGYTEVGGLVGYKSGGFITNNYSKGIVSGNSYVGGLVGRNTGIASIRTCYSISNVSGSSDYVGGLVGENSSAVDNSYCGGVVTGSSYVGGMIGYNLGGSVSNSYSIAQVSGEGSYIGGLIGENDLGTISNSYWDKEVSGQSTSGGGVGKTTAEMKHQATYVGWDFVNIWAIIEGQSYPYFLWQQTPPEIEGEGIHEGAIDGSQDGVNEGEGNDEGTNDGVHEGTTDGAHEGSLEGTSEGTIGGEGQKEGEGQGGGQNEGEGEDGGGCGCSGGKVMPSFDGFMKYLLDILLVGFLVSLMSAMKRQNKP